MSDTQEIREALLAATPGPWFFDALGTGAVGHVTTSDGYAVCQTAERPEFAGDPVKQIAQRNVNAHLIANAPEWLANLCDELDTLRAENASSGAARRR